MNFEFESSPDEMTKKANKTANLIAGFFKASMFFCVEYVAHIYVYIDNCFYILKSLKKINSKNLLL